MVERTGDEGTTIDDDDDDDECTPPVEEDKDEKRADWFGRTNEWLNDSNVAANVAGFAPVLSLAAAMVEERTVVDFVDFRVVPVDCKSTVGSITCGTPPFIVTVAGGISYSNFTAALSFFTFVFDTLLRLEAVVVLGVLFIVAVVNEEEEEKEDEDTMVLLLLVEVGSTDGTTVVRSEDKGRPRRVEDRSVGAVSSLCLVDPLRRDTVLPLPVFVLSVFDDEAEVDEVET